MKSSIKIELGENNAPVIEMKVIPTEDVRDKLCKQFTENLRYSRFVDARFDNRLDSSGAQYLILTPIGDDQLIYSNYIVESLFKSLCEKTNSIHDMKMCNSGKTIWFESYKNSIKSEERNRLQLSEMSILDMIQILSEDFYFVYNSYNQGNIKGAYYGLEIDGIPRRNRIDHYAPVETAIWNAMQEVEKLPADEKLSNSIVLLSQAKDLVSDYIDSTIKETK